MIDYVDEFEGMSIFVGNLTEWKQLGGNLDFPKKISFKVKQVRKTSSNSEEKLALWNNEKTLT